MEKREEGELREERPSEGGGERTCSSGRKLARRFMMREWLVVHEVQKGDLSDGLGKWFVGAVAERGEGEKGELERRALV